MGRLIVEEDSSGHSVQACISDRGGKKTEARSSLRKELPSGR